MYDGSYDNYEKVSFLQKDEMMAYLIGEISRLESENFDESVNKCNVFNYYKNIVIYKEVNLRNNDNYVVIHVGKCKGKYYGGYDFVYPNGGCCGAPSIGEYRKYDSIQDLLVDFGEHVMEFGKKSFPYMGDDYKKTIENFYSYTKEAKKILTLF